MVYHFYMNIKNLRYKLLPKGLVPLADETYRKSRLGSAHVRYGMPAKNLRIIAVTGTNGKTSTCSYLNDVLKQAGYSTAMFTTAVIEMAGGREINKTHRTVPLTSELFGFLKQAKKHKVDWVILEVTSHALHQHKLWGIPIEIAVMTNLTQDHLDYHGTMARYAEAKAKLFSKYMNPKWCVLNVDDEWFDFYKQRSVGQIWTYGKKKHTDLHISSITSSSLGVKMRLDTANMSILATSPVVGEFNGYNLAAVVSASLLVGIRPDVIRKSLETIQPVPGRMEMIQSAKGFSVVVDYAHTSDALEKALKALRTTTSKTVSVVFGATGDRDPLKRPIMGEIAAKFADKIYLTDDETYSEDGNAIRRSVFEGIIKGGGREKTIEIADRKEAIEQAVKDAVKGDMILVAGLGHQDYRAMNEGHIPWQESEVVREILAKSK